MSDKETTCRTRGASWQPIDAFMFPGFALSLWSPPLACSAEWNTKLHEGFAALSSEWQDFVSRRMKQDLTLLQRLGSAQSPEQIWAAYATFWQEAAEDYSQEFARVATLTGSLANKSVAAMQRQMEEVAPDVSQLEKAA